MSHSLYYQRRPFTGDASKEEWMETHILEAKQAHDGSGRRAPENEVHHMYSSTLTQGFKLVSSQFEKCSLI